MMCNFLLANSPFPFGLQMFLLLMQCLAMQTASTSEILAQLSIFSVISHLRFLDHHVTQAHFQPAQQRIGAGPFFQCHDCIVLATAVV